ncbi:hypothetical protein KQ51_01414 [Candidatus Izimaplasma bacterium HR1]|jgi:branched-subunit amino acid ABC-type transport system permease component|uniref:hypothetical protein n=1 Tax=Candidatus Izimoplasma sp. HR1 TaxID=1541959 RepID=UPI0004F788B8|nr:hypothetical protein KQ51_01414 [Candidatus Izimaplasma bacterium HR1]
MGFVGEIVISIVGGLFLGGIATLVEQVENSQRSDQFKKYWSPTKKKVVFLVASVIASYFIFITIR